MTATTITALRRRLARWESDHLRTHCAELADRLETAHERIDALESEASRAWDAADDWRNDAMNLAAELQAEGHDVGLTQDGALVAMPQPGQATAPAQPLPAIGTRPAGAGGTLGAIMARADGSTYGLIVADAEHEITGEWGVRGTEVPDTDATSGAINTQAMLQASSPIAKAIRALSIEGHADWHIASRLEMLALYHTSPGLFGKEDWQWTSSQYSRGDAWCQDFGYGGSYASHKDDEFRARPVRSIQLQPFNPSALPTPIAEGDSREISQNGGVVAGVEA